MKHDEVDQLIQVVQTLERPREALEERISLIEDRGAIHDLVMLYGWLCDRGRWDDLLSYYTDDFERTLSGTLSEKVKGKDKIRELYIRPVLARASGEGAPPSPEVIKTYEVRHMIHPPIVRVSDDNQTAVVAAVYSLVVTSGESAETRRGEHEGGYIFGMRRVPGEGWKFATMTVISENDRNPMFRA